MNKLAGPPFIKPLPIWTYRAVPMVPPMPGQSQQRASDRRADRRVSPISWIWRDLRVRWVWSPEMLRIEVLSGEPLPPGVFFSGAAPCASLTDTERRAPPSTSTAVEAMAGCFDGSWITVGRRGFLVL